MMRPNTSSSGILSTKRNKPVSTSRLTRMLVPKPNSAFQSPGVHNAGLRTFIESPFVVVVLMGSLQSGQHAARIRDPSEDATLCLDHFEPDTVELGKV